MTGAYPEILSRYFSSVERCDLEELTTCFSEDATLIDDGRTYQGRTEIVAWRWAAGQAYEFIVEVLDWQQAEDGTYVVATNVASAVSGEPVGLMFRFALQDGLVDSLLISP
jgi:uncharacterized protein YijF (DUF1287 family)